MRTGAAPRSLAIAGVWLVLSVVFLACSSGLDSEQSTTSGEPGVTSSTSTLPPATTTSTTTTVPSTTAPTTTTTVLPWELPADQITHVEGLVASVEALRGRSFEIRPWVGTVSPGEYASRHGAAFSAVGAGVVEARTAFLELLGMVAQGVDLQAFYAELEHPRPSPFYDPVEQEVLIPDELLPLDGYHSLVLVGELTKALSHQHHPALYEVLVGGDRRDADRLAAHRALLEGEAVLVQTLYLESLAPALRASIAGQEGSAAGSEESGEGSGSVPEVMPRLLVDTAAFATGAGAALAMDLYRQGGFTALDQALDRPPETTEQVFHSDLYRTQEPVVEVDPFSLVVSGYEVVEEGTWGELRWRGLLAHHADPVTAARAAEGWGGDRFQLLWSATSGKAAFAARLITDSFAHESEANAAIRELVRAGMDVGTSRVVGTATEWAGADYAMIAWDVGVITWVVASDTEVGRQIAAQLGINLA